MGHVDRCGSCCGSESAVRLSAFYRVFPTSLTGSTQKNLSTWEELKIKMDASGIEPDPSRELLTMLSVTTDQ